MDEDRQMLDNMQLAGYKGTRNDRIQSHPTSLLSSISHITQSDVEYVLSVSHEWPFIYFLTDYNVLGFHRLLDDTGKWYYLIPIGQVVPDDNGFITINNENGLFASQIQPNADKGSVSQRCHYMQ
jgi:hypothetical protein